MQEVDDGSQHLAIGHDDLLLQFEGGDGGFVNSSLARQIAAVAAAAAAATFASCCRLAAVAPVAAPQLGLD